MSNWQEQDASFNLNAPEFVPKFGGSPQQQQPQQQPQQQGQQQYQQQQQQQQFYNGPPQFQNLQQQQQYFQQQQFYQQQQQQQQQQFYQQRFQQPQQLQQQQQPQVDNKDKSTLNDLTAALSTMNTSSSSSSVIKTKGEEPKKEEEPKFDYEPDVTTEKSQPPSVATIKEDNDEWDNTNDNEEEDEGEEDLDKKATVTQQKKKKPIVHRELKAKKEPVNVIFCGHVDAGKSTIGGQIMFLTGMVDKRTMEKYEREAKEQNRESWYLSWALDTNLEERAKGKTVEVGRAFFETEKKHFIILDAPGHKGFVPNMIGGASQADIAVLVISARKGEFETGFERGGQTREHAMLVKTAGVKYMIILINKMDDTTVNWEQERYDEIKDKLTPFLKKCGFQPGKDAWFMPCSGFTGAFIKEKPTNGLGSFYDGECFIEKLDNLPTINRQIDGPLRFPIVDKYKDMGTILMGKVESGYCKLNQKCMLMPNKVKVEIVNVYCEDEETDLAVCGENVKVKIKGVEEDDISSGFVLCDMKDYCQVAKVFDAQVVILECPSIICPGFNSIMHIHTATVELQLKFIIGMVDKKTGEKDFKNRPRFIKQDQIAICRFEIQGNNAVCMETFKNYPQLGRFILRYESKTVSIGKILKIIE